MNMCHGSNERMLETKYTWETLLSASLKEESNHAPPYVHMMLNSMML